MFLYKKVIGKEIGDFSDFHRARKGLRLPVATSRAACGAGSNGAPPSGMCAPAVKQMSRFQIGSSWATFRQPSVRGFDAKRGLERRQRMSADERLRNDHQTAETRPCAMTRSPFPELPSKEGGGTGKDQEHRRPRFGDQTCDGDVIHGPAGGREVVIRAGVEDELEGVVGG